MPFANLVPAPCVYIVTVVVILQYVAWQSAAIYIFATWYNFLRPPGTAVLQMDTSLFQCG